MWPRDVSETPLCLLRSIPCLAKDDPLSDTGLHSGCASVDKTTWVTVGVKLKAVLWHGKNKRGSSKKPGIFVCVRGEEVARSRTPFSPFGYGSPLGAPGPFATPIPFEPWRRSYTSGARATEVGSRFFYREVLAFWHTVCHWSWD